MWSDDLNDLFLRQESLHLMFLQGGPTKRPRRKPTQRQLMAAGQLVRLLLWRIEVGGGFNKVSEFQGKLKTYGLNVTMTEVLTAFPRVHVGANDAITVDPWKPRDPEKWQQERGNLLRSMFTDECPPDEVTARLSLMDGWSGLSGQTY